MKKNAFEEVYPGVWRIRFGTPSAFTPITLRNHPPASCPEDLKHPPLPFDFDRVKFRTARRGALVSLPAAPGEDFYGLGLQLRSFRQTGKKKHLRVNSDPVADTGDSHAPVPFLLSTSGYGIFADTLRYATFYCASHPDGVTDREGSGDAAGALSDDTGSLYAAGDAAASSSVVIDIPAESGVDIYVFGGPDMRRALRRYIMFSGGGAMPPMWGLGVCYRGYVGNDGETTLKLARELRDGHMPCDCFGLEPGWQSRSYSCSYVWDRERFPDPEKIVGGLREMGFRINLWEHAFVNAAAPFYREIRPRSGNMEVWQGLVPDFSTSEARAVYGRYHYENFFSRGIDAFKIDECDNSDFIASAWSFPEYAEFPSGMDGEEMHSAFGNLCMKMMDEAAAPLGRRLWHNIRNAHALAAPEPFVLYSDLYRMDDFIRGLANAAFSGLLWSPEVRQCQSDEELIRRLQLVVFSPMALVNGWMIKMPPWRQVDVELNKQGIVSPTADALTALCREVLKMRMRLLPLLYTAFAEYAFEGVPPVRPLVTDYTDDPGTREVEDEFLIGRDLLFAPVTAPERGREVYFPEGVWHHYSDGRSFRGGQRLRLECGVGEFLLFVRDGAVIPWADPVEHVAEDTVFRLVPRIYGSGEGICRLYDGDMDLAPAPADAWLELRCRGGRYELSRESRIYRCADAIRIREDDGHAE